ncbi:hypothetical protein BN931_1031 [Bifidobacterium animalis subsp. lactis CECT 8145]|nr:hypothetical protein W91_0576 [Bifidobacterium animalis subsp. lactis Bi-07]AJD33674.1 hypothetical protein BAA6_0561 [Bifidobacterium animalis]QIR80590.1 hypothetical protein M8PIadj_0572 [Bifidobacterium animalis]CDL71821.1 hypothetical protein BN931_1031 [Bifidobacterium animalis subsp. lactis CECT 8145]
MAWLIWQSTRANHMLLKYTVMSRSRIRDATKRPLRHEFACREESYTLCIPI